MKLLKLAGVVSVAIAMTAGMAPQVVQANTTTPCWMLDDPIYQVVNPTTGTSLLSRSLEESTAAKTAGFTQDLGSVFHASTTSAPGLVGVHRLYNRTARDFLFTANPSEAAAAVDKYGYVNEGVRFYVSPTAGDCTVPVRRMVKGAMHRPVVDPKAEAALVAEGWRSEGTKFYGAAVSVTPSPSPTPTASAAPTATSTPTASAAPTATSTPTASAAPTATSTPTISAPTPEPIVSKPSADTTGVPAGTALQQYTGNIVITRDGTVLDGMDIHGFVTVRAQNVTIKRSIIRGGVATNNIGLITNYGYPGLLVEDVDLKPAFPSVWIDGIKGSEFTARRVHIVGGVDSVKIHGNNVQILDSLLENTDYYASDPNQGGGPTHNDNVQILNGRDISILRSTIRGATNFAVLGAANKGDLTNLIVNDNWLDHGWCSMKLQVLNGHAATVTAKGNRFGGHQGAKNCPFQSEPLVQLTDSGNVWEADLTPITILRKAY